MNKKRKFLPINKKDLKELNINQPDIIIVTGDAYIDSPYIGAAVIGRYLESKGFSVGIISQPDLNSDDIMSMGEPKLFWGVTAGSVDSMVANYTASLKRRKSDDYTPGGLNNKRPDRALIAYSNLIRKYFKNTVPIVLGGIEASLRRVVHYDYWSNKLRRSVLFDAKADYLIYGMGEKAVLELAEKLNNKQETRNIRGLCYIDKSFPEVYEKLPSFEECNSDKKAFTKMFHKFYENNSHFTAKGLYQKHGNRYLIQNPPSVIPSQKEFDEFFNLPFSFDVHPDILKQGKVKAIETIKNSVITHRGCYGECNFCSIAVHQGTTVISRTKKSILNEVSKISQQRSFNGIIKDVGGPTANMYGYECGKKLKFGNCKEKRCLYPKYCATLGFSHKKYLELLRDIRKIKNIKKVFIASGIRYDLIIEDNKFGEIFLKELIEFHISGQLKIAPEHVDSNVLKAMGKPSASYLEEFIEKFYKYNKQLKKKQFLTYYFIVAHPGCGMKEMKSLKKFISDKIKFKPEQVQIFTPLPSTYSALMYYTGKNPWTNKKIFVEYKLSNKVKQKRFII
jgi:uncharacterized radical SAM protein YgiQ